MNIERIREFIERRKAKRAERAQELLVQSANDIFQITEYDGKLWFTYDDNLFCPCELACKDKSPDEYVNMLDVIRKLYIERNKVENKVK